MARNMFKIIEDTTGKIPTRYDLSIDEVMALIQKATAENRVIETAIYSAVVDAFKYGFALGSRYERNKK